LDSQFTVHKASLTHCIGVFDHPINEGTALALSWLHMGTGEQTIEHHGYDWYVP
jgi:hypothetical protein